MFLEVVHITFPGVNATMSRGTISPQALYIDIRPSKKSFNYTNFREEGEIIFEDGGKYLNSQGPACDFQGAIVVKSMWGGDRTCVFC